LAILQIVLLLGLYLMLLRLWTWSGSHSNSLYIYKVITCWYTLMILQHSIPCPLVRDHSMSLDETWSGLIPKQQMQYTYLTALRSIEASVLQCVHQLFTHIFSRQIIWYVSNF
jgi:hypothetical protein